MSSLPQPPNLTAPGKTASGPAVQMVVDALSTRLASGDYPRGSRLPAERQLAASLQVARNTLREALDILESKGLIQRRANAGGLGRNPPLALRITTDRARAARARIDLVPGLEGGLGRGRGILRIERQQHHLIRAEQFIHNCEDFGADDCAVITAGQVKGSSSTPRGTNLVKIYWK